MAEPAALPALDAAALIADLRKGDLEAINRAYRLTFDNEAGRFVLMHFLDTCGHGRAQGPGMSNEDRQYMAGKIDAGLQLISLAGLDHYSANVAALTETLEGRTDEPAYNHTADAAILDDEH